MLKLNGLCMRICKSMSVEDRTYFQGLSRHEKWCFTKMLIMHKHEDKPKPQPEEEENDETDPVPEENTDDANRKEAI